MKQDKHTEAADMPLATAVWMCNHLQYRLFVHDHKNSNISH